MFVTEFMPKGDVEHYLYNMRRQKQMAHYAPPLSRTVTDFGTAKILASAMGPKNHAGSLLKRSNSTLSTMTRGVGTHNYMAPEVLRTEHYNEKVDIYSFSLIMFYLSSGKRPFYHLGSNPSEILDRFIAGEEPRPDAKECHKFLQPLMKQCWAVDAQDRPCAEDILDSLQEINTTTGGCGISKLFAGRR
eukprot:Skav205755  [mRNA]  locus=scaffold1714:74151:75418:- [translate_table: standard]